MLKHNCNGVILPALPDVSGLSYAVVCTTGSAYALDASEPVYVVVFSEKPFLYVDGILAFFTDCSWKCYQAIRTGSGWSELTLTPGSGSSTLAALPAGTQYVWCNQDIINADTSTAAYTGSAAVEVDGADEPSAMYLTLTAYTYHQGAAASALSCLATSPDGGTVEYAWHKKVSGRDGGTVGTGASYVPPTDQTGTSVYYCIVSNVRNGTRTSLHTADITVTVVEAPKLLFDPSAMTVGWLTGQAVRRMRGKAAWEVLWEGDMTFTEVQASGKYSASVWSDAEPPAQMFYSGETMRLTVDGETKEYTAKADPYDCAYVGNRWLSLDPIEGEGDTGDDFCVTADTYLISYGFKYTCFARNPGTYHIKIARRKESSPAPVYGQEGA